jgi:RNA polymerase sigma-70 factor (ECF subfamily)
VNSENLNKSHSFLQKKCNQSKTSLTKKANKLSMENAKEIRFRQIVEENSNRISRICNYYSKNSADSKDLHQEILINIWKSLDKFRGESSVNTWIYRIAVNTSLTFAGKNYRNLNLSIDQMPLGIGILLDDDEFEKKQKAELRLDELEMQLNLLSIIDKALITMMLEGLSMREIADVIGLTEPNVKVKIHRIKENLKQQLNNLKQ